MSVSVFFLGAIGIVALAVIFGITIALSKRK